MKIFVQIKNTCLLLAAFAVVLSACNKLELDPTPNEQPANGTTPTLATLLDDANFSLLKALATKAGLLPTLANTALRFTVFAPDDAAVTASLTPILPVGVTPAMYIGSLDQTTAKSLLQAHIVSQLIPSSSIPDTTLFPNFQYPTLFNPLASIPTAALFRLTIFPSRRNTAIWVNNIPVVATDIQAVNGIIHKVALVLLPPQRLLWHRIAQDTSLTYFKAAIERGDETGQIVGALSNPGANFTVMAPINDAVRPVLFGAIYQGLVLQGASPATANEQATVLSSTPDGFNYVPRVIAAGIVLYHMFDDRSVTKSPVLFIKRPGRVFSVNLPPVEDSVYTMLNSQDTIGKTYFKVKLKATFSPFGVTAATVQGAGNQAASNILINPFPDTARITTVQFNYPGKSDQLYLNGILHKVDQVLLPPQ